MNIQKIIIMFFLTILLLSSTVFSNPIDQKNMRNENEQISLSYQFSKPTFNTITIDDCIYTRVMIDNLATMDNPGAPQLPVHGAYILLPPETEVSNINIDYDQKISYQLNHPVIPSSTPIPYNELPKNVISLHEDKEIYESEQVYPQQLVTTIGTQIKNGYNILILNLHPIQYNPLENSISYFSELSVNLDLKDKAYDHYIRPVAIDSQNIQLVVNNPSMVQSYSAYVKPLEEETYDLLIITDQSLKEEFSRLKQYHDAQGMFCKIVTIDEIDSTITPDEIAEDMRSYIKNEYENAGIQYVLLGGDKDIVPCKMLYVHGMDEDQWSMQTTLPADFYFSCLDGEFNSDNDNRWGEPNDGENGIDVDLLSEVIVGRAPCDSPDDVRRFIDKTILYDSLKSTNTDLKKILMAGEHLGDYGIASWGGNYLDLLLNESHLDNYSTIGIPTSKYDIITLYDRDHPDHSWNSEELLTIINDNIHIINHDGHSNYGYNMKLYNSQTLEMENTIPFFSYSVGCMAGGFDKDSYDCFAEYLTVKAENAAFAALMNARYGFFWSYSTDGDGTRYMREFWDAVYGEQIPGICEAHVDSREDNLYLIERSCMRWSFYGLNYFGDPTISFNIGEKPDKPDLNGPSKIKPEELQTFSVTTMDEDSEELYYLFDWNDGTITEWIGPYSPGEEVEIGHQWDEKGSYQIKVKAKDDSGLESGWSTLNMKVPLANTNPVQEFLRDVIDYLQVILQKILLHF